MKPHTNKVKPFVLGRTKFAWLLALLLVSVGILVTCTPASPTRVAMPSSSFELLWSHSGIDSYSITGIDREELFVRILDDSVVILSWNRFENQPHTFMKLDLLTGELIWEAPLQSRADAISANSQYIYSGRYMGASYRRPSPENCGDDIWERSCDAIQVDAFDITSGDITWSRVYTGMASIAQMSSDDSRLKIRGSGGKGTYQAVLIIDAPTGELIMPDNHPPTFSGTDYTNLLLDVEINPSSIVSNIAISGGFVYFLTTNGELLSLDENTGIVQGRLQFESENLEMNPLDDFRVVVEKNIVVVYLHDSQQLFAFRFAPDK